MGFINLFPIFFKPLRLLGSNLPATFWEMSSARKTIKTLSELPLIKKEHAFSFPWMSEDLYNSKALSLPLKNH